MNSPDAVSLAFGESAIDQDADRANHIPDAAPGHGHQMIEVDFSRAQLLEDRLAELVEIRLEPKLKGNRLELDSRGPASPQG